MPSSQLNSHIYEQIVENLQSGLLVLGENNTVEYLNKEGAAVYHCMDSDPIGKQVEDCIEAPLLASIQSTAKQIRDSGQPVRIDQIEVPGDDPRFIGYTAFPLRDESGKLSAIIFSGRDISKIVEIESKMIQSEKLNSISEVVITLHHEIRNPLTGITSATQLLKDKTGELSEKQEKLIGIIDKESKKIEDVMDKLNDITTPVIDSVHGNRFINLSKSK